MSNTPLVYWYWKTLIVQKKAIEKCLPLLWAQPDDKSSFYEFSWRSKYSQCTMHGQFDPQFICIFFSREALNSPLITEALYKTLK